MIDEIIALRVKAHSFKCGDKNTNKLKMISESSSKIIKVGEYYNCLFGGEYQKECDDCISKSNGFEINLQKIKKIHLYPLLMKKGIF